MRSTQSLPAVTFHESRLGDSRSSGRQAGRRSGVLETGFSETGQGEQELTSVLPDAQPTADGVQLCTRVSPVARQGFVPQ